MLRGHSTHLSKEGHRPDIDGLRALAVLPVVFLHFEIFGFGGGFVGVDIFFVISGYLITSILVDALESGNQDRPSRIALDELRDVDRGNVLEPVIALSATNAWELEQVELLALSEHLAELGLGQSESNAAVNQKDWRAPSCSHRRLG